MNRPNTLAAAIALAVTSHTAVADHGELPEVKVKAEQNGLEFNYHQTPTQLRGADTAALLNRIPGAGTNRNGPLTGIAQYRGAYGDRVNVAIDGAHFVGGGPNAMDTPLSYAPGALLKSLEVSRGIASVSAAQESIGGHIHAITETGEFTAADNWETHARLNSRYSSHNNGTSSSAMVYAANQQHKLGASLSYDHGDDGEFSSGDEVRNTFYERDRYNVFYGFRGENSGLNLSLGKNNTGDSGTAALPMDIIAIDTDLASIEYYTQLGESRLSISASYNDVYHLMDNLSHRTPPTMNMMGGGMMGGMMPMVMNRLATAEGNHFAYKLQLQTPVAGGELTLGIDSSDSTHDAVISDPTNPTFSLDNFKDAERQLLGTFIEWRASEGNWHLEMGLRHNRIEMDSDSVSFNGMMGMMGTNATMLANAFNNGDRDWSDNNLDIVLKAAYQVNSNLQLSAGLAQKSRAPTYQERYLWLPLQSTGGLADGRNYLGNLNLDSEQARELNLGLDWKSRKAYLSLQGFYRDVDDYIQGTAVTDMSIAMVANMVANMMPSGQDALQFNNVDARLYGADFAYGVQLTDHWALDGSLGYVRGKRTDQSDDLYRIAPLNHRLALSYRADNYSISLESEIADKQTHVAQFNNEQETAGYGLIHLRAQWQTSAHLRLSAGIDNLLDKTHASHLAGTNRVAGGDLAQGARIKGFGRSFNLGVNYQW